MSAATWTIVGYLGAVTLLGAWLSRRNRSSADWATGSGGMGIWMIAAGIAGTRIGGVSKPARCVQVAARPPTYEPVRVLERQGAHEAVSRLTPWSPCAWSL